MDKANAIDQWSRLHEKRFASLGCHLHHGPGRYLKAALYHMDGFRLLQAKGSEDAWEEFDHGLDLLKRGINELQTLMRDLRPAQADVPGLLAAVADLVHEYAVAHGMLVAFTHNLSGIGIPGTIATAVYRIVQESLANVRRHSRSRKARVQITSHGGWLHLEIEDWGLGFDPRGVSKSGGGLEEIRLRAALCGGTATLTSVPGKRTLVSVELPIHEADDTAADCVASAAKDPVAASHA